MLDRKTAAILCRSYAVEYLLCGQIEMYAQSYIDKLAASDPTWGTCVDLYHVTKHKELGRILGALAAAIRHGAAITHEDWGDDWIELSVQLLDDMEPLGTLARNRQYDVLNKWLDENEQRIITMLHHRFVEATRQSPNKSLHPTAATSSVMESQSGGG